MSKETVEIRVVEVALELRREDSGPLRIAGYAARFNETSLPLAGGRFVETIAPGAFRNALAKRANVPLLINHEGLPLADSATGTLTISEDAKGLRFEAELDPADPDAQRVIPKLSRGTLRKMSFGFVIAADGDEWKMEGKQAKRTVREVAELADLSIVTSPAYPTTSVALRSLDAFEASNSLDWKLASDARSRALALTELE